MLNARWLELHGTGCELERRRSRKGVNWGLRILVRSRTCEANGDDTLLLRFSALLWGDTVYKTARMACFGI